MRSWPDSIKKLNINFPSIKKLLRIFYETFRLLISREMKFAFSVDLKNEHD